MYPYLTGPDAAAVEAALCSGRIAELHGWLRTRVDADGDPELRHVLGILEYFHGSLTRADQQFERAYQELKAQGRVRAAALVAVSLGRLHHDGIGDVPVGNGWLARAVSLVEAEEPCLEQGWALLGLVGCNVEDSQRLLVNAERALSLAHRFSDVELECKALADGGLALVSLGRVRDGMSRLDQAMVMLRSRECTSPMVVSPVVCDLLSACQRAGDLARAESWLATLEQMGVLRSADRAPSFLFAHCRIAYGVVLCDMGRWTEAEVALRLGVALAAEQGESNRMLSRAALADLLVQQGRLEPAAALLEGHNDRLDALTPLARLHLARGNHELAAAVARQALRSLGGDRLRAAPLLVILVDAELAAGRVPAAEAAAARLAAFRSASDAASIIAFEARARGHIATQLGDVDAARSALSEGLHALRDGGWPLLKGALHLDLARLESVSDRSAAIAEASAALSIFQRIDAPGAERAAALLESMGRPVSPAALQRHPLDVLSRREREVFELLALGMSNPDIARRLCITSRTAEHHVSAILGKLGLRSRAEAAAFAALGGPVSAPEPAATRPARS